MNSLSYTTLTNLHWFLKSFNPFHKEEVKDLDTNPINVGATLIMFSHQIFLVLLFCNFFEATIRLMWSDILCFLEKSGCLQKQPLGLSCFFRSPYFTFISDASHFSHPVISTHSQPFPPVIVNTSSCGGNQKCHNWRKYWHYCWQFKDGDQKCDDDQNKKMTNKPHNRWWMVITVELDRSGHYPS